MENGRFSLGFYQSSTFSSTPTSKRYNEESVVFFKQLKAACCWSHANMPSCLPALNLTRLSKRPRRESVLPAHLLLALLRFDQTQYGFLIVVVVALLILHWVHHLHLECR